MVRNNIKTHFAMFTSIAFVVVVHSLCFSQAVDEPRRGIPETLVNTLSQRWLPPPKAYAAKQDQQAKILLRFREALLKNEDALSKSGDAKESDSSRLSDSDVESLKEAMKQFENFFPKGLTADSLDAIPPDLISKALSNPDLVKQAKEIAEKHSKGNEPNKIGNPTDQPEFDQERKLDPQPNSNNTQGRKKKENNELSDRIADELSKKSLPAIDPKDKKFADLMDQLRNASEDFEKKQIQPNKASNQVDGPVSKGRTGKNESLPNKLPSPIPPVDETKSTPSSLSERKSSQQPESARQSSQPATKSQALQPGVPGSNSGQQNNTQNNRTPKQPANPTNPRPSDPTTPNERSSEPRAGLRSVPRPDQKGNADSKSSPSGNVEAPQGRSSRSMLEDAIQQQSEEPQAGSLSKDSSAPNSPQRSDWRSENPADNARPSVRENGTSVEPKAGSQAGASRDIRSELDRRGFGPTMQKIIEEAQRASQASNSSSTSAQRSDQIQNGAPQGNRDGRNEEKQNTTSAAPPKQSPTNALRPSGPSPRNPQTDSSISKGLQKTGDYLNKLWSESSKNSAASLNPASPQSSSPSPSMERSSQSPPIAFPDPLSFSNPVTGQVLLYVLGLAVACVIAFIALKMKFDSVQKRNRVVAAQMAFKIEEIRSRDDLVRAFHALAKKRLQTVQSWWTFGDVAQRFHESLPEHTNSICTLSGLYEQARYFPTEHRLTDDQIQTAKSALKQCEG